LRVDRCAGRYARRWHVEEDPMTVRTERPRPQHPVLIDFHAARAESLQLKIADAITSFAGSMRFVYLHALWFALWIGLRAEKYPFGLLTMIVSLEAIFLSTFILISQNRQDEKRQMLTEHEWMLVQEEAKQNEQLLDLSRQILELTRQVHSLVSRSGTV
jgi:uncharacterized membrane protein